MRVSVAWIGILLLPLSSVGNTRPSIAAASPDQTQSGTPSAPQPISEADRALARGLFGQAQQLYAAMPPSDAAIVGQVRSMIGNGQAAPAVVIATREINERTQDALLLDGLGEARMARGEPAETLVALKRSIALDPCLGRAHYDLSRYLELSGMAGSAQKELDVAYRLQPSDPVIKRAWRRSQEPVPTPDSEIADLRRIEARPTETADRKGEIESVIMTFESDKKGDCELASSVAVSAVPLVPLHADGSSAPPTGVAVEVVLNGKKRQLLVDSGSRGIILSQEAAVGLGLKSEADVSSAGVGDDGASTEFIAHLSTLKVGNLEFRNCKVRVQRRSGGLGVQGLFGPDTLKSLLLTFDFPAAVLKTAPLPASPQDSSTPFASVAAAAVDRFVPVGMQDWTPAFRESQSLLIPTSIGEGPKKLFIMDTGMSIGLIASDVAKEVTKVVARPQDSLRGVNGVTRGVPAAGPVTVAFAGFTGRASEMTALNDLSGFTPQGEMRVSGFIGYDQLRNVALSIDYRDGLIKVSTRTP